jgi:hypothetical protein
MNFDFERIWKSKRALRERLAARPISEKLRLLDAMRERTVALRKAKIRGQKDNVARKLHHERISDL